MKWIIQGVLFPKEKRKKEIQSVQRDVSTWDLEVMLLYGWNLFLSKMAVHKAPMHKLSKTQAGKKDLRARPKYGSGPFFMPQIQEFGTLKTVYSNKNQTSLEIHT